MSNSLWTTLKRFGINLHFRQSLSSVHLIHDYPIIPCYCSLSRSRSFRNCHVTLLLLLHVCYRVSACLHECGGPQVGEVTCGGLPHLTCKRDHIKMRDHMDRRATPPKRRVTSPIWGTPPPCKQALNGIFCLFSLVFSHACMRVFFFFLKKE